MKAEPIETLRRMAPALRERFGISQLGVFGSYVRGEQKKGSDVDILVEFFPDRVPGLLAFFEIERQLTHILGVKVDLVTRSALRAGIEKRILAEVVPL